MCTCLEEAGVWLISLSLSSALIDTATLSVTYCRSTDSHIGLFSLGARLNFFLFVVLLGAGLTTTAAL